MTYKKTVVKIIAKLIAMTKKGTLKWRIDLYSSHIYCARYQEMNLELDVRNPQTLSVNKRHRSGLYSWTNIKGLDKLVNIVENTQNLQGHKVLASLLLGDM